VKVVALAGGVGAGKFLRGLIRAIPAEDLTVVVNTADDLRIHGLLVCPDIDSVTYWLSGLADRERGWGREGDSFRALEEVKRLGGEAWFSLGDLDLGTHLARADLLSSGIGLAEVTRRIARRFGVGATVLPMTEDTVTTRIEALASDGEHLDLHFQEYWVARRARDEVKAVRYEGAEVARPAPGVLEAIAEADAVLICPSNPVASIGPILALRDIREAARARPVAGVSPIVGGAPVLGMADRLMPVAGWEVSAFGAAAAYSGLAKGFVIDDRDRRFAPRIQSELGMEVAVTDTIMTDDDAAERVARAALSLLESP
jgi:LPPG:FO 2-phospho-L-lactate transferase